MRDGVDKRCCGAPCRKGVVLAVHRLGPYVGTQVSVTASSCSLQGQLWSLVAAALPATAGQQCCGNMPWTGWSAQMMLAKYHPSARGAVGYASTPARSCLTALPQS
jgi:hypothetical protein